MSMNDVKAAEKKEDGFVPGSFLLHPFPALAAGVMALNLLYLKPNHPGWWSGKLSDFAICFFLPVVILAMLEWGVWLFGRKRPANLAMVAAACIITALYFSALQLVLPVAEMHVAVLSFVVSERRFQVTPDPTDLFALPMAVLAFFWLTRPGRRGQGKHASAAG